MCDVQLPLHFTLTTFLLVHKYCSLHGGLCARYSHWPSARLWLLPFPLSSSSPPCRWLVTNGAVNYSCWAGIRYERGDVWEWWRTHTHTHSQIPTQMIVSSYARQLYILVLLPPPPPADCAINQSNFLFAFFFTFYVCRCTWSKHILRDETDSFCNCSDDNKRRCG